MNSLKKFKFKNKYVLVRVDFNVPLDKKGKVKDNSRIKTALPTIEYLIKKKAMVILITHLGKPKGKIVPELKLDPVYKELKKFLKKNVYKLNDCIGPEVDRFIDKMVPGEVVLLENLRFYSEEENNNKNFALELSKNADYYVNDAFATLHRKHASVDTLASLLPSAPGFLVEKEIKELKKALKPKKPLIWLIGGIKEDKYKALKTIAKKANFALVGSGLVDLVKIKNKKIILPVDFTKDKKNRHLDIGPKTIKLFKSYLKKAKTIIWNGPLGMFEKPKFAKGTKQIANFIAKRKAVKIIGGGESAEAIHKYKLTKKMTWVSTGGGASLEFLLGKKLPGIEALEKNQKKFK
ncbi:MAG: phosphoglycerate kinase [Nanoarchaeota archaeon]|nr:phosphoglycerate kinase [Nanoarchaeota archaeon]